MLRTITVSIVTALLANLNSIPVRKRNFYLSLYLAVTASYLIYTLRGGGGFSLYVGVGRIRGGLSRLSIGGAITPFSIPLPDVMLD